MSSGESCSYRSFGVEGGGATGDRQRVGGKATRAPPRPRATGGRWAAKEGGGQRSTTSRGGRNSIVWVPLKYASSHANIF
jgi:hypothetical protein